MNTGQSQLKNPEQKPEEFLALRKKLQFKYSIFIVLILLILILIISLAILIGSDAYAYILISSFLLFIIGLIIFIYLLIKYRKYKFGSSISSYQTISLVFLIISFLSMLGLGGTCCGGNKARDASRKSDLLQLKTALTLYYDDNNQCPPNAKEDMSENIVNFSDLLVPKYMSIMRECPTQSCVYYYLACNQNKDFVLYTDLETKKGIKFFIDSQGQSGETESPVCPE